MADALASQETLARAVLEQQAPATGATKEQKAAEKIREKLHSSDNPRSATEAIRQRQPLEKGRIDHLIDQNIGTDVKADGTKNRPTGSDVERRYEEATKHASLAKDFIEKGYDNLTPDQKKDARKIVEHTLTAWPEAQQVLRGATPQERKAISEALLSDPAYSAKVRELFLAGVEPGKAIVDQVVEKEKAYKEAKRIEDDKSMALKVINAEKTSVESNLREFELVSGIKRPKLDELDRLIVDMPNIQSELRSKISDLNEVKEELNLLANARRVLLSKGADATTVEGNIATVKTNKRNLEIEIEVLNQKVLRKDTLEQERSYLQARKKELDEAHDRLQEEKKNATEELHRAKSVLASAKNKRASQEQDFVDDLRNTFPEAAMQYLEERIQKAEEARRELITKQKDTQTDESEKQFYEGLLKRWERSTGLKKNGKMGFEDDKVAIKEDWTELMQNGPENVLYKTLRAGGMPDSRAKELIKNPEFVSKHESEVVSALIAKRIEKGTLSEDEAKHILDSKWGTGTIQRAIESNNKVKTELENLKQAGIIGDSSPEGFLAWLKKKSPAIIFAILAVILGAGALGALGGGLIAGTDFGIPSFLSSLATSASEHTLVTGGIAGGVGGAAISIGTALHKYKQSTSP